MSKLKLNGVWGESNNMQFKKDDINQKSIKKRGTGKIDDTHESIIHDVSNDRRKCVRNYTPPKRAHSSHDAWEYCYTQNILDLKNIMIEGMKKLPKFKSIDNIDINFTDISKFLYYSSSKYISPYIED